MKTDRFAYVLLLLTSLSLSAEAQKGVVRPSENRLNFTGELSVAEKLTIDRFYTTPFTLPWLRADLTGETITKEDANSRSAEFRPFKNFSGDISGRYLELMAALSGGNQDYHPALRQFITELPTHQRADGHFGWADINWNDPIDFREGRFQEAKMMPAFWGNGRMLCGLIDGYKTFRDPRLLTCARKLGDFYIATVDRFMDPARITEYKSGDTYAGGYVTCYFNGFEGLAKLYQLTKETKYLAIAERMAAFLVQFDTLPVDHTHGMLCNQIALTLLYETTGNKGYLQRVEQRWEDLLKGRYVNPAGGLLEKSRIGYTRDEGCELADWLRLNLELATITANPRYANMAERLLWNHFQINQWANGGFGHRFMLNDQQGVVGFGACHQEAVWCCNYHGTLAFQRLKPFVTTFDGVAIRLNFMLGFTTTLGSPGKSWNITSSVSPTSEKGTLFRQRITLHSTAKNKIHLAIRLPDWADKINASDAGGKPVTLEAVDGYWQTKEPVSSGQIIELTYRGGVVVEDRTCNPLQVRVGETTFQGKIVLRYGPRLLMAADSTAPMRLFLRPEERKVTLREEDFKALTQKSDPLTDRQMGQYVRSLHNDSGKAIFVFDGILK